MAKHDISKSRHLLKRLEEETIFLRSLIAQMESLSHQVQHASVGMKRTWSEIDQIQEDWKRSQE